jgi:hypothetical protein
MRRAAILVMTLVLGGCLFGHHNNRNTAVVTANGSKAYAVTCEDLDRCYLLAGKDCPGGYHRTNPEDEADNQGSLVAGGGVVRARSGKVRTWIIECN